MSSRKAFKKRVNTKRHFKRRCYERYDLDLSVSEVREIEERIKRKDKCKFIKDITNTKSMWEIEIRGLWYTILYSKKHKTPITIYFGEEEMGEWEY